MKNILSLLLILISGTIYAQSGNWGLRQFETVVQLNAIFPSCLTSSTAVNASKLAYVNVTNTYYRWDCANSVWRPMADILITSDAGTPSLTCNSSTNFLVFNAAKDVYICNGTTWEQIGSVVTTDATLSGDGSVGTPLKIAQQGASSGQVLKWNGSTWAPGTDNTGGGGGGSTDLAIGTVTSTTVQVTSSTGTPAVIPAATTSLAGVMTSTDKTNLNAVVAASHPAVTVTDNARIDLTLTGQNIQADLLQNGATTGQVYKWNGSVWAPANDLGTTYTGGTGIDVTGTVITNTDPDQSLTNEPLTVSDGTDTETLAGQTLTILGVGAVNVDYIPASNQLNITSSEIDGDVQNEGMLGVSTATGNSSGITSNTTGSSTVTIQGTAGILVTESGTTITLTAADNSNANELQSFSHASDATSHTATLSNVGGSIQLIEGAGITLTSGGSGIDGTITIASTASGTTNLTIGGSSSPLTVESSSGSDYTVTGGTGISLAGTPTNMTITNTAPDQVVALTGAGTVAVTGTYPNFTLTGSGVSSTLANNNILIGNGSNVATAVNPAGDWDITNTGATSVTRINGVNVTSTGATADQLWRWNTGISTWIPSDERTQQMVVTGTTNPQLELSDNSGTSGAAGGVLVTGLRGMVITNNSGDIDVALPTGTTGQILRSNGTTWSGQAESLQGMRVNPTSGLNPTLQLSANDGTYTVPSGSMQMTATTPMTVTATGSSSVNVELSQAGATTGQILKWNGSNWVPDTDLTGSGGTNLTATGSAPNFNINSDTGTDVGIIQGAGATITRSGNDLTIATVDQSATNESLTVTDGTNSETLGGQTLTVTGSGGAVVSYNPATNTLNVNAGSSSGGDNWGSQVVAVGAGITGDGTGGNPLIAADASATNELQTIANTSDATSHTATLSNSGGSTQFVEGTGITMATTGTGLNGIVTFTNSAPDQTVVLTAGTGISTTGTYPNFTINATKVLREETFTATAAQTAFTMAYSAPAVSGTAYPLRVYRNGVELDWVASAPTGIQYTFSGTTLTTAANTLNDKIRVNYFN